MFMRSRLPPSLEESESTQIIPAAGETWGFCLVPNIRDVGRVVPRSGMAV